MAEPSECDRSSDLNTFFKGLLGLEDPWRVLSVERDEKKREVVLQLEHPKGSKVSCPECNAPCVKADHTAERSWRHLDTMQYSTVLKARVPRSKCGKCGIKTIDVPWADRFTRMTRMMEDHIIAVLRAAASISAACKLTGIDWSTAQRVMGRAVARGIQRRDIQQRVELAGMDEKSFRRGQSYVTLLNDLQRGTVIEVTEDRTTEAACQAWEALPKSTRRRVKAVAMDMWPAYQNAAGTMVPKAAIVFDRFHVSKHLNESVDHVRRQESSRLRKEGDAVLVSTRYLWLTNPENLNEERSEKLEKLSKQRLGTARAWSIKESFAEFWRHYSAFCAETFFNAWYAWAIRSRLEPVKKVARMIKKHLGNLLTYFEHRVTNAVSEGLNSRIQSLKSAARGFRSFAHYRVRILFYCGGLELDALPVQP